MNSHSNGNLDTRFRQAIETWCSYNGLSAAISGAAALHDPNLVTSYRCGRNTRLRTVDRTLAVMCEPPASLAFLDEFEVFTG
ncbi:MAG: hypothetical protein OXJ64_07425 [Boseongicola sp.]|nr:hypothetical protein [Boseongicola sp.]